MSGKTSRLMVVLAACLLVATTATAETVGTWRRHEILMPNESWQGNPFDVRCTGTFTSPSGRQMEQFAFYAGDDTWKIYFMPDEVGRWTFETSSPDPQLDGREGSFRCTESDLPGMLHGRGARWQLTETGPDFPVIWAPPEKGRWWAFRSAEADESYIRHQLRLADETAGARLLGIGDIALAPRDWAADMPQSAVPYVRGKEGRRFYLPFWDHLNDVLDRARERGMGLYVMFFSDDALTPDYLGIEARSRAEKRLFRYAVARLGCYPIVLWDSGIDIGEYRSNEWVNWFTRWFRRHDPWGHPVGSRSGGGSGGTIPDAATYYSNGLHTMPARDELVRLLDRDEPTAFTDHWRIFIGRGNWTNRKIRAVHWLCGLSGGHATFPDYSQGFEGGAEPAKMKEGARFVGHAVRFFRRELRWNYEKLVPHDELIVEGDGAVLSANPGREYVLYDEDGGPVTVDLSGAKGPLRVLWYNPRTGETTDRRLVSDPGREQFSPSSENRDYVLHAWVPADR